MTASNPSRRRRRTARTIKAEPSAPIPAGIVNEVPIADTLTIEQAKELLLIQKQQVEQARTMFFRLAQVRAADLVTYQGKSWDESTAYINAEMNSLEQALNALVPQPPEQPA
jgi:hypothetical protein